MCKSCNVSYHTFVVCRNEHFAQYIVIIIDFVPFQKAKKEKKGGKKHRSKKEVEEKEEGEGEGEGEAGQAQPSATPISGLFDLDLVDMTTTAVKPVSTLGELLPFPKS